MLHFTEMLILIKNILEISTKIKTDVTIRIQYKSQGLKYFLKK